MLPSSAGRHGMSTTIIACCAVVVGFRQNAAHSSCLAACDGTAVVERSAASRDICLGGKIDWIDEDTYAPRMDHIWKMWCLS